MQALFASCTHEASQLLQQLDCTRQIANTHIMGSQPDMSPAPVTHGECEHEPRSTLHVFMHMPFVHLPLHAAPHDPQF